MIPESPRDDAPVLHADAVSYRYPEASEDAVHGVSLRIRRGELLAVVGPNGSGKSTLLGLLIGFLKATAGNVTLDARALAGIPRADFARRVTAIPQGEVVLPGMTVRELVLLGRQPHADRWLPLRSESDLAAAVDALSTVGIAHFADRRMETLSGGERQLVRIARAVTQGAPLMLLDEPTTALDLTHQQQIMRLLRGFCDRRSNGVLVVTHDLNLASNWADQVLLMRRGEAVAEGPPGDILTAERLGEVFGADLWIAPSPDGVTNVGLHR